jgi:hypothetical protein
MNLVTLKDGIVYKILSSYGLLINQELCWLLISSVCLYLMINFRHLYTTCLVGRYFCSGLY